MKKKKEGQEADRHGKITFSEKLKLLVDIIGRNTILDFVPKKNRKNYEVYLHRMYNGDNPYDSFKGLPMLDSVQYYWEQFMVVLYKV
jgi:hypothetical protein